MDINLMISIFPNLLNGAVITLQLLISSMFFGLIIGLFFAILRVNKNTIIKYLTYFCINLRYVGNPQYLSYHVYPVYLV